LFVSERYGIQDDRETIPAVSTGKDEVRGGRDDCAVLAAVEGEE
jgi:hypothetical protein